MLNSLLLPILITGTGTFLLFKLNFFFLKHPLRVASDYIRAMHDRDSRRSLFLALAGTLGVGNIFGVCAGLMIGGAGSVFWLAASSLFASVIKYSETVLVLDCPDHSMGMSSVFARVFPKFGLNIGKIYAVITILLALLMGSAMQSRALAEVALFSLGINPYICGFILLIFFLPCVFGGARKIENITEILVPMTTIIYIIMCLWIILSNFSRLPFTFYNIFRSAFSPLPMVGGAMATAIREGFARGILSNEAGAGSSALAHSRAEKRSPYDAGLFAMSEVFFDTDLLCILTALTVLVSVENLDSFTSPMSLIFSSFYGSFGGVGGYALVLLILSFAYSTIICWYYYGLRCISFVACRLRALYVCLFVVFFVFTWLLPSRILIYLTDTMLLTMSVFTLSALIRQSSRISLLTKK